ncbi:allantoate amidohydrolase [Microbacterium sp. MEC084]|uniref:allantoate amidohydrolase n=1 Tax=Microbacterium sp. MEC084 TaxID=1963027 RepID=UPI0010700519|nr:allantoate amidohydrolase [Microbacterium sp. MEC084]MCD1268007.1 allantoate amidohydrolase [Microbacterium sp. MEC084]
MTAPAAFDALGLLREIEGIGRDPRRGGYSRHVFDDAERTLRDWFVERATRLGLGVETDRNGNLWAWWGEPGPDAIVTGSHLDSVPGGGAHDGPLGVVSALDAVARLKAEGFAPARPLAIVVFAEEEGSRFGIACLGSRLLSGAIDPARAGALRDATGRSFADAARDAGLASFGRDDEALSRIGVFVELHVEQGKGLIDLDAPVAMASSILEHGRWRVDVRGQGNHAGTTEIADRRDPMLPAAAAITAARRAASRRSGARATIGRLEPIPGGTNVIASRVAAWMDVRASSEADTRAIVEEVAAEVAEVAAAEGCEASVVEESYSAEVRFDPVLRDRLAAALGGVPVLPTGAGHDAGVLSAHVPTAMLFVRNPSGVSHAPEEGADDAAVAAGVDALAQSIRELS